MFCGINSKILSRPQTHLSKIFQLQYKKFGSNSAAYDGDGKTTVRVLNQEASKLNFVNTISAKGFRLSNNLFIFGPIIVFPTQVYSWNVTRGIDINPESLLLFDLIVPKVKIVIIGYGQFGEPYDSSLPLILKSKGISCELLPTQHAVTTYNYLLDDAVHVAGAFVPLKDHVVMRDEDVDNIYPFDINKPFGQGREPIPDVKRSSPDNYKERGVTYD